MSAAGLRGRLERLGRGRVRLGRGELGGPRHTRFELTSPGGPADHRRGASRAWPKNVVRAERLAPGGILGRAVEYDAPAGKGPDWESFTFGPRGSRREVTLRAVFEQS